MVVRSTADRAAGTVHPEIPAGWKVEPQSATVEFNKTGEHASEFKVLPDGAKEARYQRARPAQRRWHRDYSEGYSLVARPDIGGFFYYQPALQRASVVEVKVPPGLKIGYVMGAGDDIPAVLRQLGLDVTLLTADDIDHGDLSRFGTIVLGIRAYDTRDDVKKNNQRLLDYVRNGGTLLVQYNTSPSDFNAGHYTPYPAQLSRERVTVEAAPVTILDPHSPVCLYPNQITHARFRWLGAGARPVLHGPVGPALHAAAGVERSRPGSRKRAACCWRSTARATTSTPAMPSSGSCHSACPARFAST